MGKKNELDKIARQIEHCRVCKLEKTGKAVPGEGSPDAMLAFIGEAPGKTEAATGRPFVGRSGQLLRFLIRQIGLSTENVFITSAVKYLPLAGTPSQDDIEHGKLHLLEQLRVIRPKIVVLLGSVATRSLLNERIPVLSRNGTTVEKDGLIFFLTIHPAAAIRFQKHKKVIEADFQKLKRLIDS